MAPPVPRRRRRRNPPSLSLPTSSPPSASRGPALLPAGWRTPRSTCSRSGPRPRTAAARSSPCRRAGNQPPPAPAARATSAHRALRLRPHELRGGHAPRRPTSVRDLEAGQLASYGTARSPWRSPNATASSPLAPGRWRVRRRSHSNRGSGAGASGLADPRALPTCYAPSP
jgi:hypothetical protein